MNTARFGKAKRGGRQASLFDSSPCDHQNTLDEVKNDAGEIIGERCSVCGENVAGHDVCDFCKVKGRLTYVVDDGKRTLRYCTRQCRIESLDAMSAAKHAAVPR